MDFIHRTAEKEGQSGAITRYRYQMFETYLLLLYFQQGSACFPWYNIFSDDFLGGARIIPAVMNIKGLGDAVIWPRHLLSHRFGSQLTFQSQVRVSHSSQQ